MPQKTLQLWDTPFLIPPRIRGDGDFKGHGPQIQISTRLYVSDQRKIAARVWMYFAETQSDWTTSSGTYTLDVYDGSFDNVRRINDIVSPRTSAELNYEQERGHDPFTRPGEGPVREYYIVGDTRGDEAGTRTGAAIRFNQLTIDYEEEEAEGVEIDIDSPVIEYIPPHTRGDRDFGGHGPRVWCTVQLEVRNNTEIWSNVYMKAEETQSDRTTAEGSRDFLLYTHPRPIATIVSSTRSDRFYRDSNHADDVIDVGGGELVRQFIFVGDTRGDEAGTRTKVLIHFNPIRIREL